AKRPAERLAKASGILRPAREKYGLRTKATREWQLNGNTWRADCQGNFCLAREAMIVTISIFSIAPEGFRWQVVEAGKVLRTGRTKSRPQAFYLGNREIREVIIERASATHA